MGNNRYQSVKRRIKDRLRSKKGETLVETVVSFVIVLVALSAITMLIHSATAMNAKAKENSDKIEAAAVKVEQSAGKSAGTGQMVLDFGSGTPVKIDIDVKTAEPFTFFTSVSGGDGQ